MIQPRLLLFRFLIAAALYFLASRYLHRGEVAELAVEAVLFGIGYAGFSYLLARWRGRKQ